MSSVKALARFEELDAHAACGGRKVARCVAQARGERGRDHRDGSGGHAYQFVWVVIPASNNLFDVFILSAIKIFLSHDLYKNSADAKLIE